MQKSKMLILKLEWTQSGWLGLFEICISTQIGLMELCISTRCGSIGPIWLDWIYSSTTGKFFILVIFRPKNRENKLEIY